jgi:protein-S-isoprenylcysteine O-methyltransferase Ste14
MEGDRRERRLNPPAYFLVALVLTGFTAPLAPGLELTGAIHLPVGLAIIAFGAWLNLKGSSQFDEVKTPVRPLTPSTTLVTDGVYRLSRNPMYLGLVCILAGVALAVGTVSPLVLALAFGWLLDHKFITAEEQMLEHEFGSEFQAYRKTVRRWI